MQGTIKELIESGMKVNGVFVDQAMLSVLVRLKIGTVIGEGPKPTRGKSPVVVRFESSDNFVVTNTLE